MRHHHFMFTIQDVLSAAICTPRGLSRMGFVELEEVVRSLYNVRRYRSSQVNNVLEYA
jgi:hypothetical protein